MTDYETQEKLTLARIRIAELEAALSARPAVEGEDWREKLQRQCTEWGAYWRAPDAHGVELTEAQAIELLQDVLGVEVEIKEAAVEGDAALELQRLRYQADQLDQYGMGGGAMNIREAVDKLETLLSNPAAMEGAQGASGVPKIDVESLPSNPPMHHDERGDAEQAYTLTAFDYVSAPVGSRDWTLYWRGWWHRAVIHVPPPPPGSDWPEDFSHENGNYHKTCYQCGNVFFGHKRRIACKTCARTATGSGGEVSEAEVEAALNAQPFIDANDGSRVWQILQMVAGDRYRRVIESALQAAITATPAPARRE